jgi:hypothetical protein
MFDDMLPQRFNPRIQAQRARYLAPAILHVQTEFWKQNSEFGEAGKCRIKVFSGCHSIFIPENAAPQAKEAGLLGAIGLFAVGSIQDT